MYRLKVEDISELSYGQKYLLDLIDQRKLAEFCRNYVPERFSFAFNLAIGKVKFPPANFIYKLRNIIYPGDWFVHINEEKPERKPLNDIEGLYDIKKSINYNKILKMHLSKSLYDFTQQNGLNYSTFTHLINGLREFSPTFMYRLHNILPPEDWFIYTKQEQNQDSEDIYLSEKVLQDNSKIMAITDDTLNELVNSDNKGELLNAMKD